MPLRVITQSEYSRYIAHTLDDQLERWRLRKETRLIPMTEIENIANKYSDIVNSMKLASSLREAKNILIETKILLNNAERFRQSLKDKIRLATNEEERQRFAKQRKLFKPELSYCHLLRRHAKLLMEEFINNVI